MATFSRDHLIVGAVGFVLGGIVSTASITAILMTQHKEEKVCPPISAIIAPEATLEATPPPLEAAAAATTPTVAAPQSPPLNTTNIKGLVGEEADKVAEDQKQLIERKKNLESQLSDSNEIMRLKEQQIKDLEAKLKEQP